MLFLIGNYQEETSSKDVKRTIKQYSVLKKQQRLVSESEDDFQNINRIGQQITTLKQMNRENGENSEFTFEERHQFYFNLVQDSSKAWPVRLQAFRNLKKMEGSISWDEREKILQQVDKRILHLSQYTDEELLEQVVEHAQNY